MKRSKNLNQSLGAFTALRQQPHGVHLQAENGLLELQVYNPHTVRVRAYLGTRGFESHSYAVVARPETGGFQIEETADAVHLTTSALQARISKSPLRVAFYDLQGKPLNADDPAFGMSWLGDEGTVYKTLKDGERFIGLGEKTGGLDRRGSAYEHWNTDAFAYGSDTDPLYLSTPFYMGIHADGMYGIFLDNSYRTRFNFGASSERNTWFSAADGDLDYYFFHAATVAEMIGAYTWLTGRMAMPPLWSLGYQQCRYSYYPDTEVLNVARTFREKQIPADVIYLDIHYMDAYKIFTWHPDRFSEPAELLRQLREMNFHVVIIVDPGIKREKGYAAYESGLAEDHFVKLPDGEVYHGQVWPGWSAFPDFTRESTRNWWGDQFKIYTEAGVDGFWNDMNEPAAWGQSLPDHLEFHFEGEGATHKQARNVYGMNMARATRAGTEKLLGRRPFILTRAGFSGVQRHAAVWTGDNVASDEHMLTGIRLVNSLGLTGVAFAGYDLGGFAGEASPELYARWMALAAFSPFFRGHSMINTRDSEPWTYGEEVEEISRNYIGLRYQLMPYVYSAFYEASVSGMPVARSLAIEWPLDAQVYAPHYENEYLFGPSILVIPVESHRDLAKAYLPPGGWYDLFTDAQHAGGQEIVVEVSKEKLPLFVRAGAVIAMQPPVQNTAADAGELLHMHVYAGDAHHETVYYEDDGSSFDFQEAGYFRREIRHDGANRRLELGAAAGNFGSRWKRVRVWLHGLDAAPVVQADGEQQAIQCAHSQLVQPISQFDPAGAPQSAPLRAEDVSFVELEWGAAALTLTY